LEEIAVIIETLTVGPLQTNCYVFADPEAQKCAIIDPGGDAAQILATVSSLGVVVQIVIDTHGHADHILANRQIVEATGAPLAIHPLDADMLHNPLRSLSMFLGKLQPSPEASVLLADGDLVPVGSSTLQVLHTPGHTPGSVSVYCAAEGAVFSGDALFHMGVGRSDLGGNHAALMNSIRTRLLTLPDETVVYPGHGPQTTIGYERRHNPFLR
jgi:hydroxyacylglutathione hydrolase